MPSINEVILRVGKLKPNVIDDDLKAMWLLCLDNQIYREMTSVEHPQGLPPKQWPEDGDMPLLVKPPYDKLYDSYLKAMIEFYMREYAEYNNTQEMFASDMTDYRAYYRRKHTPAKKNFKVM